LALCLFFCGSHKSSANWHSSLKDWWWFYDDYEACRAKYNQNLSMGSGRISYTKYHQCLPYLVVGQTFDHRENIARDGRTPTAKVNAWFALITNKGRRKHGMA
jgi:hypothetical protein